LLAGAGTVDFGAALRRERLTARGTGRRELFRFGSTAGAPCLLRLFLTGFTGLDAAVMRDEGMSAPAGHDPIFRYFLGASEAGGPSDR